MANKQQVVDLHRQNPALTSGQIAKLLNCGPGYVVSTFKREGLTLPNAAKFQGPRQQEREACARLAEDLGSPEIAAAIRARADFK